MSFYKEIIIRFVQLTTIFYQYHCKPYRYQIQCFDTNSLKLTSICESHTHIPDLKELVLKLNQTKYQTQPLDWQGAKGCLCTGWLYLSYYFRSIVILKWKIIIRPRPTRRSGWGRRKEEGEVGFNPLDLGTLRQSGNPLNSVLWLKV